MVTKVRVYILKDIENVLRLKLHCVFPIHIFIFFRQHEMNYLYTKVLIDQSALKITISTDKAASFIACIVLL